MESVEQAAAPVPGAVRDSRGRWAPGQSGNPAGKPPGTRNRASLAREQLRDGDEGTIMRRLIEQALEGNLAAARFVLDGTAPKPRGAGIDLGLPPDAPVEQRMTRTIDMMCAGEIAPEDARVILSVLRQDPRAAASPPVSGQYLQDKTAARAATPHPNPPPQGGRGRAELVEALPLARSDSLPPCGGGLGRGDERATPVSDQYFAGQPLAHPAPTPPASPPDDGPSPEFYLNRERRRAERIARGLPPAEDEARALARLDRILLATSAPR